MRSRCNLGHFFLSMPAPLYLQDRSALLENAAEKGVVTNYSGWRVSLKGKKFQVKNATLFNLVDMRGDKVGQAVIFDEYELEDGTVVKVRVGIFAPIFARQAACFIR